jgi:hypothetical protein
MFLLELRDDVLRKSVMRFKYHRTLHTVES